MRIKYFFLIIACSLMSGIIAQTADVKTGCAPLFVTFTSPPGYTSYHWDFGNGGSSNDVSPQRLYDKPGVYYATLTKSPGSTKKDTIIITVFAKPVPKIVTTDPLRGCVPLRVNLLGSRDTLPPGVTVNSYTFDFGDGTPSQTTSPLIPVKKTYVKPGKFTVTLEISTTMSSCNTTLPFPDYISTSLPPATSFTTSPNPPSACAPPLTVTFTNTTTSSLPLTYEWKVGTNPPFTGVTPPPFVVNTTGTYTVTLTATDTNKCSSSAPPVIINIGKPIASFKVKTTACMGDTLQFTNNSSGGFYNWDFGSGAKLINSSTSSTNPQVVYTTPGVKKVKLTVTSNGCSNETTVDVTIENPVIDFTATPVYSCSEPMKVVFNPTMTGGTPGTWSWFFSDPLLKPTDPNNKSVLQNPTHTYKLRDSIYDKRDIQIYPVILTAISAAGCKASITKNDTLFVAWARFVPDKYQGCAPLTVTFSDSSRSNPIKEPLVKWEWDYGDGVKETATTKGPQVHTYTNPGVYFVQLIVTNKTGCKDTSYQVKIEVGGPKVITFTASPQTVCPGDSILLTNTTADKTGIDGWHYSSNGDLFSHCSSSDIIKVAFNDSTGIRNITLTGDYNGCLTSSAPIAVNVKGPLAKINFKQTCGSKRFEVELDNFKSGLVSKYHWDFGDSTTLDTTSYAKITHTYKKTGDYKVVLTATNDTSNCPISKDSVTIHIRDIQAKFAIQRELCIEKSYLLDGSASVDVNAGCYRGYSWVFSDPKKRPITYHTPTQTTKFASTGDQTISLIVEDINGCKDTSVVPVKVFGVRPQFSVVKDHICLPATVNFKTINVNPPLTVADTTIAKWKWTFGDNDSLLINGINGDTNHIYTTTPDTVVKVLLVVTDVLGCTNQSDLTLHIYHPISSIAVTSNHPIYPPNNICLGETIKFEASDDIRYGSHLKFEWNLADGSPLNTNMIFNYTYAKSGTFPVTLKFTEVSSGCVGNLSVNVRVQDYPKANFTSQPDNNSVLCYPRVVNFQDISTANTGSPITTYHWDFGNGITADSLPKASTTFKKGVFKVTEVVGTSFGCKDSITKTYTVVGPEGDYAVSPMTGICRGDVVTFTTSNLTDVKSYVWDFADGSPKVTNTVAGTVKHTYSYVPASGTLTVFLTLQDVNQVCSITFPVDIDIHNVKSDFTVSDTTPCLGTNVLFVNKSIHGNKFEWSFGDNTTSTQNDSIYHTYSPEGKYTVTLITKSDTVSCKDTLTKTIRVMPLPVVTAKGDSICPGTNGQLIALPNNPKFSYHWAPTTNLGADSVKPVATAIGLLKTVKYTAFVTDTNGCVGFDSTTLFVFPEIKNIDFDTTIIVGDVISLPIDNLNGGIKFTWTPTEGLSCLQCSRPEVHPLQDAIYNVYMEDKKKCSSNTGIFKIHVKPITFIKVPTTFTPNGDGNNDIIYVKGWGIKDLISFQIYNRWGELVFETSELSEGWNGYYKDVLQNNDVYTYKVVAKMYTVDESDKIEELQGHINLMR